MPVPNPNTEFEGIIKSLLDTDLYKFSMIQTYFHQFNKKHPIARFKFHNRSVKVNLAKYVDEINKQLDHLCTLRFAPDEIEYLRTIKWLKPDFIDFLKRFQLTREYIKCFVNASGELEIFAEGPITEVSWFEIYVLAIVQEVYTNDMYPDMDYTEARKRLMDKIEYAKNRSKILRCTITEMGSRRRFNYKWHREAVETLVKYMPHEVFVGTSNVLFAKEMGLKPFGTMAHEYLQLGQAIGPRLADSQKYMLEAWAQEYRGDLGIALSDVVGFDAFLRDFDKYFAKLFDGARHDSGDPYEWCEKLIAHYESLNIDPITKSAVFSDGLDFVKAFALAEHFRGRIRMAFGIGTNISNDVGVPALQLVMKLVWVFVDGEWHPVAKVSDSAGKGMCEDAEYESYLKKVFKIGVAA